MSRIPQIKWVKCEKTEASAWHNVQRRQGNFYARGKKSRPLRLDNKIKKGYNIHITTCAEEAMKEFWSKAKAWFKKWKEDILMVAILMVVVGAPLSVILYIVTRYFT